MQAIPYALALSKFYIGLELLNRVDKELSDKACNADGVSSSDLKLCLIVFGMCLMMSSKRDRLPVLNSRT